MLDLVGTWNTAVVARWDHKVNFKPSIPIRTGIFGVGGYIICDDLIWQWVSLGTTPTSISFPREALGWNPNGTGRMKFQWSAPRFSSYSSKTDSPSGTGLDSGPWHSTNDIMDRYIRARDLPAKALSGKEDLLFAYAQAIISP